NDAATKAAAEALARLQSEDAAVAAAIAIAAENKVAGRPLTLTADDIQFGHASQQNDGSWNFDTTVSPHNAVRIQAKMSNDTANGSIGLFFGPVFGQDDFSPERTSIAAHLDQEIALVIDRSHSMCFDMSGVSFSYPYGTPRYPDPVAYPPHNSQSRWAALERAMNTFLDVAGSTSTPPRISMSSFGSDITLSTYEGRLTGRTFPALERDAELSADYGTVRQVIADRGDDIMLGGTTMSVGMDDARAILTGPNVRPLAKKIMIVFTDGQWNRGRNPIDAAYDAKAEGIKIYTVTFLQAEQSTMQSVAEITGGQHLHAQTAEELEEIFRKLALTLPVVLTE
ncbi:MAG: VWA domain-containing protein, partial [Planctomycetaceae bacterium]|nr:VWA domain-containing protein [Planctomycetaceae bacterium]